MSDKNGTRIKRIRIEVSGPREEDVRAMLVDTAAYNREHEGGEWEVEDPGVEVQGAKNGYWGRVTIRRKDAQGDPVLPR